MNPKHFYGQATWDESAWLDVVSIEYERLIAAYPFAAALRGLSSGEPLRALDLGCGTGIFPRYLDPLLPESVHLNTDLWDISPRSLASARQVLDRLEHFSPQESHLAAIEDVPSLLPAEPYDVIWAVHSFTTVDVDRMRPVIEHLHGSLTRRGSLYIYQLTAASAYQALHQHYRQRHLVPPYMEYEDTEQILKELGLGFEVVELGFDHIVSDDSLENYLHKCVLDEALDVRTYFQSLLGEYRRGQVYHFPQTVNFVAVPA